MDLTQFVKDATTTESRVDSIKVDPRLFSSVLQIIIAAGNMLDQIKKNTFYDKPFNTDSLKEEFVNIVASLDGIKDSIQDGLDPQETMYTPRIFHSVVGIATEAVELLEGLNDESFDTVNFLEELGDLSWYQAIGIDAVEGNFDDVLNTNIDKLKARYPGKFDKETAVNRDLDTERDILDAGLETNDGC